jgi:hypothetical protein
MKFVKIFLILTFLLCNRGQAQLRWETRSLEFHPSPSDTKVVADFPFTNTGRHPVKIKRVQTSCGCTTATPEKEVYAPGEKGKITAIFEIGSRSGEQQKNVYVSTDAPKEPDVVLTFKATIAKVLDVDPIFLNWQRDEELRPKTVNVTVMNGFPVTHLTVTCSNLNIAAEVKHKEGSRNFQIVVTPRKTEDGIGAGVEILPDYPKNPPKYFHVYTRVEH